MRRHLTLSSWICACLFSMLGCTTNDVDLGNHGQADHGVDMQLPDRGVDTVTCTIPPPPCNWCSGEAIKDNQGCVVDYRCANGASPCKVQPCTAGSCDPGHTCGADKLCWSDKPADAGVDAIIAPDLTGYSDAGPSQFACGDSLMCVMGQYCEETLPGACGGNPLPDAGTCPANCQATTCPGSPGPVCVCRSYACKQRPVGCLSCSCLNVASHCTCKVNAHGIPEVTCSMP